MELINYIIDLILHLDRHLAEIIQGYGIWTYLILFLIVFCETGLVVTPFLPGDSLLFAAGALAALEGSPLSVWILFLLLTVSAILGDTVNYWIGSYIGPKAFTSNSRFFKKEYLIQTQEFYNRHGGKTIIIARFVPIIRTFAPFVAGIGTMNYLKFIIYNVVGGVLWVFICLFFGYLFGNIPIVKRNFSLVILVIIFISLLPGLAEIIRHKLRSRASNKQDQSADAAAVNQQAND